MENICCENCSLIQKPKKLLNLIPIYFGLYNPKFFNFGTYIPKLLETSVMHATLSSVGIIKKHVLESLEKKQQKKKPLNNTNQEQK
jgi:hypothetical protein